MPTVSFFLFHGNSQSNFLLAITSQGLPLLFDSLSIPTTILVHSNFGYFFNILIIQTYRLRASKTIRDAIFENLTELSKSNPTKLDGKTVNLDFRFNRRKDKRYIWTILNFLCNFIGQLFQIFSNILHIVNDH